MVTAEEIAGVTIFAALGAAERERLSRAAADISLLPGEYAVQEGGERALFALLEGRIEAIKVVDGIERVVGERRPGGVFGEVPITLGTAFPVGFRAAEMSRIMRVDAHDYHAVVAVAPGIGQQVGTLVPARGIHHIDLAVRDVARSLAFYLAVLGPLGLREESRDRSYRRSEEVVYLRYGDRLLGLRPADGGEHRYYEVGIEHLAFYVDSRDEVDAAYQRCLDIGARIHFPPEGDQNKYELFVFDPDGIRVEVGCVSDGGAD